MIIEKNRSIKKSRKFLIVLISASIFLIGSFGGCTTDSADPDITFPKTVTLHEASRALDTEIPVPSYIPADYLIQSYTLTSENSVLTTISSGQHSNIELHIAWHSDGKFIPAKFDSRRVDINGTSAFFLEGGSESKLLWYWKPVDNEPGTFAFQISANATLPENDLFQLARSIK